MIYLPKCVAPVCRLAGDGSRYAMDNVRLLELDAGVDGPWYRLEATDGKVAAIVRGPSAPVSYDEAATERLPVQEAPAVEALLPAGDLEKALRGAPKEGHLGVCLGEQEVLLSTWSGVQVLRTGQGHYPCIEQVLPPGGPLARARVNPRLLIDLLQAALAVCPKGDERVELLFYTDSSPLGVMARGEQGLTFDGLIMPLS